MAVFIKLSISVDILNGYADAWLMRWCEIGTKLSGNGPVPDIDTPPEELAFPVPRSGALLSVPFRQFAPVIPRAVTPRSSTEKILCSFTGRS
jgi:hypothetical protein